jgi:hypothetical protein
MYQQIMVDKSPDRVLNVPTLNEETDMKATEYTLKASNGRHIRKATKVTFPDGYEVRFIEKMAKAAAIRAAVEIRSRA